MARVLIAFPCPLLCPSSAGEHIYNTPSNAERLSSTLVMEPHARSLETICPMQATARQAKQEEDAACPPQANDFFGGERKTNGRIQD